MNVKGGERSRINWIGLFCELFAGRSFQRESQCESTIGTKYFLITQSSFTRSLSQVQNIIKKQALSIKYFEGRPLSNEKSSQEHGLIISCAF